MRVFITKGYKVLTSWLSQVIEGCKFEFEDNFKEVFCRFLLFCSGFCFKFIEKLSKDIKKSWFQKFSYGNKKTLNFKFVEKRDVCEKVVHEKVKRQMYFIIVS